MHDLQSHYHGTAFADGYDVHSGNQAGNTNAIFQPGGQVVAFITRPTAALASDVGAGGANTGGPHINNTGWVMNGPQGSNGYTDPAGGDSTYGMDQAYNTGLGGPGNTNDATGAVSPANGNVPPYVTVNFIIRIG
jgi:hypothetical protein